MHSAVKHSIVHHFADDTNLLCSDRNPSNLRKKLSSYLNGYAPIDFFLKFKKQSLTFSNLLGNALNNELS